MHLKISVITVSYNAEKYIEKTIQSVIRQNYSPLEYIIIDGNSTDGTCDMINQYSSFVTKWISEPDRGIYDAMNKGISLSTGEIICFLNCGDWFEDYALEKVDSFFRDNPNIDMMGGNTHIWDGDIHVRDNLSEEKIDDKSAWANLPATHQSIFYRKECFDRVGNFDTDYPVTADNNWNNRAFFAGITYKKYDEFLSNYLLGGVSSDDILIALEKRKSAKRVLEKLYSDHRITKDQYQQYDIHISKVFKRILYLAMIHRELQTKEPVRIGDELRSKASRKKIILWGLGENGKKCLERCINESVQPDYLCDSSSDDCGINGQRIMRIDEVLEGFESQDCFVMISSSKYEDEMKDKLRKLGYKEDIDFCDYQSLIISNGLKQYGYDYEQ